MPAYLSFEAYYNIIILTTLTALLADVYAWPNLFTKYKTANGTTVGILIPAYLCRVGGAYSNQ